MIKTNFSKENLEIFELTKDLARGDFSTHIDSEKLNKKALEDFLRDRIQNEILGGRTLYQAVRRNNIVLYEIFEEIVNVTIGENVLDSPFINAFVETKNRYFGDMSDFYSEGGMLSATSFAGNHWDTDREPLDVGEVISLPKEWVYVNCYEDLERFLLGVTGSLEKITDKVYSAVNKYIKDRLHVQFHNVENSVPADFVSSGNDEGAVSDMVDKVAAAGGYDSITIAGTRSALRKLADVIPDKMFADSQREAKALTGSIGNWEGNALLPIPQVLKSGTFDLALDNTKLFIMGGSTKPIKLEFEGDTRTKTTEAKANNNDMTVDTQIQTKFGMGLVLPPYFGVFTMV